MFLSLSVNDLYTCEWVELRFFTYRWILWSNCKARNHNNTHHVCGRIPVMAECHLFDKWLELLLSPQGLFKRGAVRWGRPQCADTYSYVTGNNSLYTRSFSSSQVQHMVNSVCGVSILFYTSLFSLPARKLLEDKRGNSRRRVGTRATSKLEKNFFKQGSPKTTSNTRGAERAGGKGRGRWVHVYECVCTHECGCFRAFGDAS